MKTLKLDGKNGTFLLDDVDIGDYLEAEFVRCVGIVDTCRGVRNDLVPVIGYEILLTLSANACEPEIVVFTSGSRLTQSMVRHCEAGEKLVMTARKMTNHKVAWYVLGVNGAYPNMLGKRT